MAALFSADGWMYTDDNPELIIINTCTVTSVADKKSRNLIRRLRQEHPRSIIAVCGCYVQRATAEIEALGGVDIIVGVEERQRLPELVQQYLKSASTESGPLGDTPLVAVSPIAGNKLFQPIMTENIQPRARAYLKIEDGCDQFCHYCIIPHVRGLVRSLPLSQAVEQARLLVESGHREIVLSGIHIGAYGSDLAPGEDLPALIRTLLALPELLRLRLGSIELQQFDEELIELFATEKSICGHLHIPLQAGCDKILATMGRRYDTGQYRTLITKLRQLRPDTAFTTDIIVGYPGESDADFAAGYDFIRSLEFAKMHIFPYSKRSGTPAATLPDQISRSVKTKRAARLGELNRRQSQAFYQRFVGKTLDLLGEKIVRIGNRFYLQGHSSNYLNLLLPWDQEGLPQGLLWVEGVEIGDGGLKVRQIASE